MFVKQMAFLEDRNNSIESGWATGDNSAYKREMKKWEIREEIADVILELTDCAKTQPNAISEYGGGSECCNWFECDSLNIGIPSCGGIAWAIPCDVEIPEIENYEVKTYWGQSWVGNDARSYSE
jgi:hypothetical protein